MKDAFADVRKVRWSLPAETAATIGNWYPRHPMEVAKTDTLCFYPHQAAEVTNCYSYSPWGPHRCEPLCAAIRHKLLPHFKDKNSDHLQAQTRPPPQLSLCGLGAVCFVHVAFWLRAIVFAGSFGYNNSWSTSYKPSHYHRQSHTSERRSALPS